MPDDFLEKQIPLFDVSISKRNHNKDKTIIVDYG
jgi:hypothetical protein